jgi:hypothetical protein
MFATGELEPALTAWFKQACAGNASIDGTHLKEVLHFTAHLGTANILDSSGWINRFKRKHNSVYRTLSGESRSVDSESIEDWRNDRLLQVIEGYDFCDIR